MIGLTPGDPVPLFTQRAPGNDTFRIHAVAGRYVTLVFVASAANPATAETLARLWRRTEVFQGEHAVCLAVTSDPDDERLGRVVKQRPGHSVLWDANGAVHSLYGIGVETIALVLDPTLRFLAAMPIANPVADSDKLAQFVAGLPPLGRTIPSPPPAPVLVVPRVFEPEFCRSLIDYYDRTDNQDSGFMRTDPKTGLTVAVIDHTHKKRRDCIIEDAAVRGEIRARIMRRLVPEIKKAFQFDVAFIERYIVACYDATEGGYFRLHRDNTTKGTEHRRFAVTINLNAEDYDGGDLRFPEYDHGVHRAPTGGAVAFSCSLLHEATPITRGRRYCVLPFLYDEAAAIVRDRNLEFVADPKMRAKFHKPNRAERRRQAKKRRETAA